MGWFDFLSLIATLAERRKENGAADVVKLLRLGASIGKAGEAGREALLEATAKVRQLVDEDRGLTDDENASLDASIEDKLARAAAVQIES
jgi:hypothetical protein